MQLARHRRISGCWLIFVGQPIAQRRIANPRHLVGQRAGRLDCDCCVLAPPAPRPASRWPVCPALAPAWAARSTLLAPCVSSMRRYRSPRLADAAQVPHRATGALLGRQATPAGKVPRIGKVRDIPGGGCHHGGGGQQAHPRDTQQARAGARLPGQGGQLPPQLRHPRRQQPNLFRQQPQRATQRAASNRAAASAASVLLRLT